MPLAELPVAVTMEELFQIAIVIIILFGGAIANTIKAIAAKKRQDAERAGAPPPVVRPVAPPPPGHAGPPAPPVEDARERIRRELERGAEEARQRAHRERVDASRRQAAEARARAQAQAAAAAVAAAAAARVEFVEAPARTHGIETAAPAGAVAAPGQAHTPSRLSEVFAKLTDAQRLVLSAEILSPPRARACAGRRRSGRRRTRR